MRRELVIWSLLMTLTWGPNPVAAQDSDWPDGPPPLREKGAGGSVPISVLFTNLSGDPSALIPGLGGVEFEPGTGLEHFYRVVGSPGFGWALTARADLPSSERDVLLVDGELIVRQGTPAPWTGDTKNIEVIDPRAAVNDAGDFAFAVNTTGPTGEDEYLVTGSLSSPGLTAVAQEGTEGIQLPPGVKWGDPLESPVLRQDGELGFVADGLVGLPANENEAVVFGGGLLAQEGLSEPPGQATTLPQSWENFDTEDFWLAADGGSWLVQGDLFGDSATDDVVAVDGTVVLQEGFPIAGSTFAEPIDTSGILGVAMDPAGNWFARGHNAGTEQDWVVRNGEVVAAVGDPVVPGSSEIWSDVGFDPGFFAHAGNERGDWLIGGITDDDPAANGVLVLNGATVVVRESDPIDLDGNGSFDDDLFFDTFGNDDLHFGRGGRAVFIATVKNGSGTRVGQGVFVAHIELPIFADGFESGDTSAWSAVVP